MINYLTNPIQIYGETYNLKQKLKTLENENKTLRHINYNILEEIKQIKNTLNNINKINYLTINDKLQEFNPLIEDIKKYTHANKYFLLRFNGLSESVKIIRNGHITINSFSFLILIFMAIFQLFMYFNFNVSHICKLKLI